ncbi:MAG: transcription termination/antitermination protein NusA [Candidatus Sungiibacteriota bacterium]|uniref:Transcription termination/antitermination protein NusA n=1 Tax=Candidatus Sungiibacteriota bacterium TaxID=2750080 RepID=A0A7T5RK87_9BACT|nr:MAG: transcription termination/antitermination protein NusA [Candidatus Sungbacteria bacterium]
MDLKSFAQAIQQIADEKGIPKEKILETIELALAAAYKRDYGQRGQIVRAKMDPDTGKVEMKQIKIVMDETMIKSEEEIQAEEEERARKLVEAAEGKAGDQEERKREEMVEAEKEGTEIAEDTEPKKIRFNEEKHMMIEEARKIKKDIKPGDELEFPLEYHEEYGRIAAQTAKQVIVQRIREAEREAVFDEFKSKEGELVSGLIQRIEGRNIFVDIGRTVGILIPEEQVPYERYRVGDRIKVLITLVEKNPKGPGVFLSRSHPRLLKKLFEIEVPEIASGTVEIKSVAREPGSRSKVAVLSHEEGIDPVGSLVGQRGVRVTTVINELGGEKIDVIEWSEDPAEFITHSLSPAKVLDVEINEKRKEARAVVPDEQLSLAIGKGGQNVRLAAKLTGWKIDVRSSKKPEESQVEEAPEEEKTPAVSTEGVREALAEVMGETKSEEKKKEPKTTDGKVETQKKKKTTKKTTKKEITEEKRAA